MKKRALLISFFVFLGLIAFKLINESSKLNRSIASLPLSASKKNLPRLKTKPLARIKKLHRLKNRVVYGNLPKNKKSFEELDSFNTPSTVWRERLTQVIEKQLNFTGALTIKPLESYALVKNEKIHYVESVLIKVKNDDQYAAYRAEVDSQTGEVLKTWDHSIYEDLKHH